MLQKPICFVTVLLLAVVTLLTVVVGNGGSMAGPRDEHHGTATSCISSNSWSLARSKWDYGENVEFLGDALVSGIYHDVWMTGEHAFAVNVYGLMIFDISAPDTVVLMSSLPTPGQARVISVSGNYAYVGDERFGLVIVDISDLYFPEIAGSYQIGNEQIRAVFVHEDHVYVGVRSRGLYLFEVSDPTTPALVGVFDPGYDVNGVWVEDSLAYIADYWHGLRVVDVSNPDSMFEVGDLELPGTVVHVSVLGSYAYVAAQDSGMRIVDISAPDSPVEVGHYKVLGNQAKKIIVEDTLAYIACSNAGLHIADVSAPESPAHLGDYDTQNAWGLDVADGYVSIADLNFGLRLIDVEDPTSPWERSAYQPTSVVYGGCKSGNYVYLTGERRLLSIVDVSDPTEPLVVYDWETSGHYSFDVYVRDSLAYIAAHGQGLKIVDVADPTAPTELGSYDTPCYSFGIDVEGDFAYIADGDSGLRIIDIADPEAPFEVGFYDSVMVTEVDVDGSYAYIVDSNNGLYVLDVSDPSIPHRVGSLTGGNFAFDVRVSGDLAYLAWSDFSIVDISDPSRPRLLYRESVPSLSRGIFVEDTLAYLVAENGLFVFDVADTNDIEMVGHCETPGVGRKVWVSGDTAYVSDQYDFGIYHFVGTGGVVDVETEVPSRFYLSQNYPNPFNSTTKISYALPRGCLVTLEIWNLLGQKVATLVDGFQRAGPRSVFWGSEDQRGNALSSGVYFCRLRAGDDVQTRKMVLMN